VLGDGRQVPTAVRKRRKNWRSDARRSPQLRAVLRRFGCRVKALREQGKLTQERAAELAGLDARHLQAIEAGEANVTMATLNGLARSLGVAMAELMDGV
jgi:DNA-binding XRE family transcriptional regulator